MKTNLQWNEWEASGLLKWYASLDLYPVSGAYNLNRYTQRNIAPGALYQKLEELDWETEDQGRFEVPQEWIKNRMKMACEEEYGRFRIFIIDHCLSQSGSFRKEWISPENFPRLKDIATSIITDELTEEQTLDKFKARKPLFKFSRYVDKAQEGDCEEWEKSFCTVVKGFLDELDARRFFFSWRPCDMIAMSHKISSSCYRPEGEYSSAPLAFNSTQGFFVGYTTKKEDLASGGKFRVKTSRMIGYDCEHGSLSGRRYKHALLSMVFDFLSSEAAGGQTPSRAGALSAAEERSPYESMSNTLSIDHSIYTGDWTDEGLHCVLTDAVKVAQLLEEDVSTARFYDFWSGRNVKVEEY